ncbi:hypothetical protein LCGC14_2663600 [marine sediment metagenome]|uniref:Uncharacterized protein n=1 Tax=marine sediment metagenome TaxID=412755 RepID=A0A0F8ZR93_9ZZZZ
MIAVGTKMPAWVETGFAEYQRRFPKDMALELIEIPAGKRGKNADIKRILHIEGEKTLAAIPKGNRIVTLEVTGKALDTHQLAKDMLKWQLDGRDVSFPACPKLCGLAAQGFGPERVIKLQALRGYEKLDVAHVGQVLGHFFLFLSLLI